MFGESEMSSKLSGIGKKLSRLFLGRIVVKKFGELHRQEETLVSTHYRKPAINVMRPEPRVGAALFVNWKNSHPASAGSLLGGNLLENFKVSGVKFELHMKTSVKQYKFRIENRAAAKNGMWRMKRLPHTRKNRLNFLKTKPKFERATLLALYSPLFQSRVKRSVLDKASGNLLFWYDNDKIKLGGKYHLLLLRVFGETPPLKWVWIQADKKLS